MAAARAAARPVSRPRASAPGLQLRMRPQPGHVVDLRVRDLRLFEALAHLLRRELTESLDDLGAQRVSVLDALGIAGEAFVLRQCRPLHHLQAELLPLALVLQPQHHRLAVPGGKGAIGVDGGVRGASARRGGAPSKA